MANILQLQSGIAWRQKLKPALFRGERFHVDTGVRESGRRIVGHEFPKRDVPYAEDMGRRARDFTVRGYIIVYPRDGQNNDLQKKNYIPARDRLIKALETEGPAELQLPLLGVMRVACTRYRITEESRLGGFCVFDMTFTEYGQAPAEGVRQSAAGVVYAATEYGTVTQNKIYQEILRLSSGAVQPPNATPQAATPEVLT
ncbi:MAG TPA: DNA circularization N-terminal domain-containing protein [Xanthobacteraceae bacterium]|nr:DNA circularization N-terminal domain-containing protein [Xanthobacteraceae bacterium]